MTEESTNGGEAASPTSTGHLVFLSHDSRDAALAEAFSKLLSSVSAGMLKTFRSSDKDGTQGIEFGVEWYPELMRNLHAATDVVCLLTTNSLNRPWILYEAGVAKGKLDAPVHGLAIGVPLASASTGPFAQFQNCDDDVGAITKLVVQLVKRIPNADPDQDAVRTQVELFKTRFDEILAADGSAVDPDPADPEQTARLFEEIKVMFSDLPARVERAASPSERSSSKRRGMRVMDELRHLRRNDTGGYPPLLIALSILKDDFEWLYDAGLLAYAASVRGDTLAALRILNEAANSMEFWVYGMRREPSRDSEFAMHEVVMPGLAAWREDLEREIESSAALGASSSTPKEG